MNYKKMSMSCLLLLYACGTCPMTRVEKAAVNAIVNKVKLVAGLRYPGWQEEANQLIDQLERNYVPKGYERKDVDQLRKEIFFGRQPVYEQQKIEKQETGSKIEEQKTEPKIEEQKTEPKREELKKEEIKKEEPKKEELVQKPVEEKKELEVLPVIKRTLPDLEKLVSDMLRSPAAERDGQWYGGIGEYIYEISRLDRVKGNEYLKKVYSGLGIVEPVAEKPVGSISGEAGGEMKKAVGKPAPLKKIEPSVEEQKVEPEIGEKMVVAKRAAPPRKGGPAAPVKKAPAEKVYSSAEISKMPDEQIIKLFNELLVSLSVNWKGDHKGAPEDAWNNKHKTITGVIIKKGLEVRSPEEIESEIQARVADEKEIKEEADKETQEEVRKAKKIIDEKMTEERSKLDKNDPQILTKKQEITQKGNAEKAAVEKAIKERPIDIDKIKEKIAKKIRERSAEDVVKGKTAERIAAVKEEKKEEAQKLMASRPVEAPVGEETEADVLDILQVLFGEKPNSKGEYTEVNVNNSLWLGPVTISIRKLNKFNPDKANMYKEKLKGLQQEEKRLRE